jgi:hypothetical protein
MNADIEQIDSVMEMNPYVGAAPAMDMLVDGMRVPVAERVA